MKNATLYYSVGPLLYCPANDESIVHSLVNQKMGVSYSLALCLEDTINDHFLEDAENKVVHTINALYEQSFIKEFYMPKIFIRVRTSHQITNLMERFGASGSLITGFVLPKFSAESADGFIDATLAVSKNASRKLYMMPIIENPNIINLKTRYDILYDLKAKLDRVEEYVLTIRIGGNDLCHYFGMRRLGNESIHSIRPIATILSDIYTVFGMDYVIASPVWEYYNGEGLYNGLANEAKEDRLNGFVGKTVIHPNQIAIINETYKVLATDLSDAKAILNWDAGLSALVSGSENKERMNEYKTHYNWAQKTIFLSEAFGIKDN